MGPGWPGESHYVDGLLVVGGADVLTGNMWSTSGATENIGLPHVYGPGGNLIGADGNKANWGADSNGAAYKVTSGTSVGKSSLPQV